MAKKIIVILGPNASGKTSLSIKLALWLKRAEIISADSRQVYKGLDIGAGKITKEEMKGVPHHLIDVASPKRKFSAANYKKLALEKIREIHRKDKIPIIVGGTAFYIETLTENVELPEVKPDWKLREKLEKKSPEELFSMLQKKDKRRAKEIDKKNKRRLIRALEIITKTGRPVPLKKEEPLFEAVFIGIKKEEPEKTIAKRLKKRLKEGMVEEVKNLNLSWKRLEELGLEYRYVAYYLQDKMNYEEMVEKLQKEIEKFSKRQMTWFKKDKRIRWVKSFKEAKEIISNNLS